MKKNKIIINVVLFLCVSFSIQAQKKWSLQECVNQALNKNISVQKTKFDKQLATINVKNAKANFLPDLNLSANSNLNFGSTFDPVTNDRVSVTTFGGSLGVNSSVTIFNGFRNLNNYKLAKLGVKTAEIDLKLMQNNISLQVVNLYLNALFSKENLTVSEKQLKISEEQLNRIEERFKLGAVAKGEVLNYQSTVANDKQKVISSQNNLQQALFDLAQLIQVSDVNFDISDIEETISADLLYNNAVIYQKALKNFPEIKRAKNNVEQADLNISIAKSGYYPTINFNARMGSNYGINFDLPEGIKNKAIFEQLDDNLGYGIGLGINIPIFNGFRNDNNVVRSKINKEKSLLELENQKLILKQKIQKAYLEAKLALNTYETSKILVEKQQEAFQNSQEALKLGAITVFDFEQVRNRLVNAESTLIRSKYDYIFKTKVLHFYSENKIK